MGTESVDLVQQHPGQLAVVVIEPASQRVSETVMPGPHLAAGQAGQDLRVALPRDQRLGHVPDRLGAGLAGHRRDLDRASSSSFSSVDQCRVRSRGRSVRSRV
jgi:hypothetical protein